MVRNTLRRVGQIQMTKFEKYGRGGNMPVTSNEIFNLGVWAKSIFGAGLGWCWINTFADNGKKVTLERQ